jgi:hypothetical protein
VSGVSNRRGERPDDQEQAHRYRREAAERLSDSSDRERNKDDAKDDTGNPHHQA